MYAKELIYTNQDDYIKNLIKNESNDTETVILKPIYENVKTNKVITLPDAINMNYINNESNYIYNNNNNINNYEQNAYNQNEETNNIDYNDYNHYNNIITNPSSSIKQITNYVNMMHNKTMTFEDAQNFKIQAQPFQKAQNSNMPDIKKVIKLDNKDNKNENKNNVITLPPRKENFREVVKIIQNDRQNPNIMTKKLPYIDILNNNDRQSNPIYKTMNLQESRLNLGNDNTANNDNNANNNIENNNLNNTEIIKINSSTQTEETKIDYNISIVPVDDLKNKLLKKREKKDRNKGFHGVKAIKVYSPKSNSNFNYNLNFMNSNSYKDFRNYDNDFNNRLSNYRKYNIPQKQNNIEFTPKKNTKVINFTKKADKNEFSPSKRFIVDYGRNDNDKYSKYIANGDKRGKEKNYRYSDYHSKANLSKKDEYANPKKLIKYTKNKRPLHSDEKNNELSKKNHKKVKSNKIKEFHSYLKPEKENKPLYYYEKNNEYLDEYDNAFNTHEKFINKMKNLFDF